MIRRPPTSTLFPSPPLFRSSLGVLIAFLVPQHNFPAPPPAARKDFTVSERVAIGKLGPPESPAALSHFPSHAAPRRPRRSEEHTSELQSQSNLVCRLLLANK